MLHLIGTNMSELYQVHLPYSPTALHNIARYKAVTELLTSEHWATREAISEVSTPRFFSYLLTHRYLKPVQSLEEIQEELYTLTKDELITCWGSLRNTIRALMDDDDLCLEHSAERYKEHLSCMRRVDICIEKAEIDEAS